MRRPIDLDIRTADSFTFLVHGLTNVGKTFLIGDALAHEAKTGPVRFLNIAGEDGQLSISALGLGKVGETVETPADFDDAIADFTKLKLQALGLDSLKPLATMLLYSAVGEERIPDAKVDGERAKALWGLGRTAMENLLRKLRSTARYVLAACPSDKSINEVTGKASITPDLFGKLAHGCAGSFDFVAYLTADVIGPGKVRRVLSLAPATGIVTRQRLPHPILRLLVVPEGGGGWATFKAEVKASLEESNETAEP